jgi:DNA-binding transcriptional LysR family regulator
VALVLGGAPVLLVVLLGLGVPYFEWNGRLMMGGFALASATWGIVLARRPIAWAVALLALVTTPLIFVHLHDRPAGIRLLEPDHPRSVWREPKWAIQARNNDHMAALIHFVDNNVPANAHLALMPNRLYDAAARRRSGLMAFPFFGDDLGRTIVFAESVRAARAAGAGWAILPEDLAPPSTRGWRPVFRFQEWVVLRLTA